ncbi:MAG TPA: sulfatase-like hydrolase/transferase, partial [Polyangiaceae bacterium]|nr:sulfatase-like hydrolase/transferase [Polyangiaceae bacterium]
FLMIDSLRADMPWTGYERPIAPWLSKYAEQSTLYPRSYSLSSYTAKSVAPTLTGRYPSEMARDGYFFTRWLPENVFVTERAQQAGHRTLAGHAHGYFLPGMGLDQGFDDYRLVKGTFLDTTGVANVTSEALNALAKQLLSDPKNVQLPEGKRFFAYFHFLDPHYTYIKHDEHPDWGNKRRDLYDNEVHYSDKWVGDLISWAEQQPWGKDTAVIITADHGEGFGERNQYRHAYELWECLIRVPLFIHVPEAKPRRIEASRGHIDLAPTIADLMGLPTSEPAYRGQSLVPEVFGEKAQERPVISELPRADLMDRRRALVHGDYKLIAFGDDTKWMLFNVIKDFKEEQDLSASEPEKLAEMRALYLQLSKEIPVVPISGGAPLRGAPRGQRW